MDNQKTKFCKHCADKIPIDAVICTKCGRQVEELKKSSNDQIIINNNNNANSSSTASAASAIGAVVNDTVAGRPKNKWISLMLCILTFCGHKFYEGKIAMGFIYLFTFGLFFVGWIMDIISLFSKPDTYYV